MLKKHSQYMKLAIAEAWKYQFLTYPNPAVGATVVKNNKVLAIESHKQSGGPHAEVFALKEAYLTKYTNSDLQYIQESSKIHKYLILNHNDFFRDCEIYVTLEPCSHVGQTPACAVLLESIKIKKVYIGTMDPNNKATGGYERLKNANINVEVGINKEDTDKLLEPFIKYQSGHFCFYKIAMREDESIDGGYITTQDSLNLVHNIRTKLDLMVIGGNTVRIDRPTLDSRFSLDKKPSDILIYSTKKNFDKNIPLFQVPNREVTISSNFDLMKMKKFVMIEGGYNLLKDIENKIDYIMLFVSHKIKIKKKFEVKIKNFETQYSYYINEYDEIIFLKKVNDN